MKHPLRASTVRFAVLCFIAFAFRPLNAYARVNLDVLRNDGYGMAEFKRPDPNILTVIAEINGHKMRLIVDTGWAPDGIFLHNDRLSDVRVKTKDIKGELITAFGSKTNGYKGGYADSVRIGNVQLAKVPIYFGNIGALRVGENFRKLGADGFLGAGFMKRCSAIVDLQNLRVYMRPPGTGRRAVIGPALKGAGLAEVPMSNSQTVEVAINDHPAKMIIDTGAYHAGADIRFAEKIRAAVRGSFAGSQDATGKVIATKMMQLRSFKIGGVPALAPDLRLTTFGFYSPNGLVGLLGIDILGPNGAIIDFGAGKLYFYPATK